MRKRLDEVETIVEMVLTIMSYKHLQTYPCKRERDYKLTGSKPLGDSPCIVFFVETVWNDCTMPTVLTYLRYDVPPKATWLIFLHRLH